jgi:hypothetical protein
MAMDMGKLPINVTIRNLLKDCKYICGDFIFTVVCCVCYNPAKAITSRHAINDIKALWADLALEIFPIEGIVAHVIFSEICIGLPCSIAMGCERMICTLR